MGVCIRIVGMLQMDALKEKIENSIYNISLAFNRVEYSGHMIVES